MNDLDQAIIACSRSRAALPDLMRALGNGELWFFIPWHPEIEGGVLELKNGDRHPWIQIEDEEGPLVPLFSSLERTREAMKAARFPARTIMAGSMPATNVLAILGRSELRAVLNKGCQTGQLVIPANMMRDVADGTAFQPAAETAEHSRETMQIIDPADYPTTLVQSAFELMRRHRNFRAAWLLGRGNGQPSPAGGRRLHLMMLMEPRDAAIVRDLDVVVGAECEVDELSLGYVDENDEAYIAHLWKKVPPFYVAPDYEGPPGVNQ